MKGKKSVSCVHENTPAPRIIPDKKHKLIKFYWIYGLYSSWLQICLEIDFPFVEFLCIYVFSFIYIMLMIIIIAHNISNCFSFYLSNDWSFSICSFFIKLNIWEVFFLLLWLSSGCGPNWIITFRPPKFLSEILLKTLFFLYYSFLEDS